MSTIKRQNPNPRLRRNMTPSKPILLAGLLPLVFIGCTSTNPTSAFADVEYSAAGDFLDLLTLPARKKIAARNLEQTKMRVAHEVLRLASEVQTAFYRLQAREQFVKRLNATVQLNEAAADLSRRQYDAGNINDLELHNQQAAYAQARLDLAQATAHSRADRERVHRLVGLWGKQTELQPGG